MDLVEDEPRQHPKPMPFCQKVLLQPVVPEVSLLLQDNSQKQSEKKNDSFSGTEFQTYNSWKWKHMNQSSKPIKSNHSEPVCLNKEKNIQNCYLIKDKYFTSDIEKRKNEILYGDIEEPRRPLPPRANAVIPTSIEPFFSKSSLDESFKQEFFNKATKQAFDHEYVQEKKKASSICSKHLSEESDNSEKLYSIISEQNKQMKVLQNQIDQLLRLQEVKDKQIEQLLNSQESKEKKIEHLMESLEAKGKEMSELLSSKEKQEQNLQEILRSNEMKQKEIASLLLKLNEPKQKETESVGVMANVQLIDACTYTSLDDLKRTECSTEREISCIRDSSRIDEKEKSISLHSSDLPVIHEVVPTPQSSIHLDIQDFPDSSDESEIEATTPCNSLSTDKETQARALGFTFYDNVLTQLKDIIKNSEEGKSGSKKNGRNSENKNQVLNKSKTENNFIIKKKKGAIQSFQSWNILEKENGCQEQDRNERISEKSPKICVTDGYSPSDISLKINALAMKYLKKEQISQCGLQSQIPGSCQHDVTIYNVTNLSFGSMRYLDRYQMLPNAVDNQKKIIHYKKNDCSPVEFLQGKAKMTLEQNITSSIGNILDITTLNQQPKLL